MKIVTIGQDQDHLLIMLTIMDYMIYDPSTFGGTVDDFHAINQNSADFEWKLNVLLELRPCLNSFS